MAALLTAVVLTAGCGAAPRQESPAAGGSTATSSTTTSSTTTSGTAGTSTAGSPPATTPGGRMTVGLTSPVVLQRAGGFAGRLDRVEVRPDGSYVATTRRGSPVRGQLSEARLATVVDAVRRAHLGGQPQAGPPTAKEADVFRYRLTAEGRTVTFAEGQAGEEVSRVVAVLLPLLSEPAPTP